MHSGCCCGQLAAVREALEKWERGKWTTGDMVQDLRAALSPDSIGECPDCGHGAHPTYCKAITVPFGSTDRIVCGCQSSAVAECPHKAEAERYRDALAEIGRGTSFPMRVARRVLLADPPKEERK